MALVARRSSLVARRSSLELGEWAADDDAAYAAAVDASRVRVQAAVIELNAARVAYLGDPA